MAEIQNLNINSEEWFILGSFSQLSVDIEDSVSSPLTLSGTYFLIDGIPVATTYSGISGGYRFFCDAPSSSGSYTATIHMEDGDGTEEVDFNMLFGYRVVFDEYVDWGVGEEVTVWSTATNNVMCPNRESFATYFRTKDYEYSGLGAYINPIGGTDGFLTATIYPQSKYLLPGYTYTITLSGIEDYSGNKMSPIIFNFTVKD
jgi:hypothetical protein